MEQNYLEHEVFPVTIKFRIGTIHNDFEAKDGMGNTLFYAKQKLFKFKEHIKMFEDAQQSNLKYEIRADKWLDFNTCYNFTKPDGTSQGKLLRKGWRSLWKAAYDIYDENNIHEFHITESNPWIKVLDALLSEVPVLGIFTGYLFNPTYNITRPEDGTLVCKLKKNASFFGRTFTLHKESNCDAPEQQRLVLGATMMILLERRRG